MCAQLCVAHSNAIVGPQEVGGLACLGAGVREKKVAFVGVKVYSVALYVDAAAASAALVAGKTLLEPSVDKMLSIKLARKVRGRD